MFKMNDSVYETLNLVVTKDGGLGYSVAQFDLPYSTKVREEAVIEIDNYLYKVKSLDMTEQDRYSVECSAYLEELVSKRIDRISEFGMSLKDALEAILDETGWTYSLEGTIAGSFGLDIEYETVFEALEDLKDIYYVSFWYDTKAKVIYIWQKDKSRSTDVVVQFTGADSYITCKSSSEGLVTRLIPIGKEKTTINLVNDNCLWLENHQYTDEIIVGYYTNSKITNPDNLKTIAEYKLKDISKPAIEYTIKGHKITKELRIGDSVRVIDKMRVVDEVLSVQTVCIDKTNPAQSYIKVGSIVPSFADNYSSFVNAQEKVNKDNMNNFNELFKRI